MSERSVLLQQVIYQRTEPPKGFRIWSDGSVQRCAESNALPSPTERLDKDRTLIWEDDCLLATEQLEMLQTSIRDSGFLDLPPALLLNYCTEDPGTAIWQASIDGQSVHVVVWDPRPRRSSEIDKLIATVNSLLN